MSQNSTLKDDEIDMGELFAALWSQKILIILITGLSIFFAGYLALTTEKTFTSQAIFQIEKTNNNSGFNLPGELGALASLAGFNGSNKSSSPDNLLERLNGREFIVAMSQKFSLDLDLFFNTYDPNYRDPLWKAIIKRFIGWQKTEQDKNAIIEISIIKNFRDYVKFETTEGGAILIKVTHRVPQKAADYANGFTEEIRLLVENESIAAQKLRLNYLSETLADALQEMDDAQENLKNYALKNSALAQENFISDSLKLDQIRMEKRNSEEIFDLLLIIQSLVKSGNLDSSSYATLRSNQPLVDDVEFRRILGMSETISAWTWPKIQTIEAVSTTLQDRIKRLDVNISNIEENAKIYATSAEDLAKFKRDALIAEATYKVLIEQVKSHSLVAGFKPETFKIFEYAKPPLGPSSPKRNLLLALGTVLGMLIGCALALINAIRKDVYYKRSTLLSDASPKLALKSKSLRRLSRKSISDIISFTSKRRILVLDQANLKLADKKIIFVLNSGGQPSASNATRLLASHSAKSGRNVILCNTTGQSEKEIKESPTSQNSNLPIISVGNNISVVAGVDGDSFFTSTSFNSTIKDLTDRFDQVFVCATNLNAQLGLMALAKFNTELVVITSLRKTKKIGIKNIKSWQHIDLLFYD